MRNNHKVNWEAKTPEKMNYHLPPRFCHIGGFQSVQEDLPQGLASCARLKQNVKKCRI